MELIEIVNSFLELGKRLKAGNIKGIDSTIKLAEAKNPWFTQDNIDFALSGITTWLQADSVKSWISKYKVTTSNSKQIGVVMAGNIPLVGIHDAICVLMSGHSLKAKLSSQDDVLIPMLFNELIKINPAFSNKIEFVEKLSQFDGVIATGSDNTSRYFEYYFSKVPHLIRKNRTSIAILNGDESSETIRLLADDIFRYFGLGCRNVSKIYIPTGYDISKLFPDLDKYHNLTDHHKYHNNYYYHKSILLVNQIPHFDTGFALFRESPDLVSPIGTVFYEYYNNEKDLSNQLRPLISKIQCIVSNSSLYGANTSFGQAQHPQIGDYADQVDTMDFLLNI